MTTTLASYTTSTTKTQEDALSGLEKVGAFATGAVLSGINSIANTGVDVINWAGGDAERFDTAKQMDQLQQGWGQFYQDNAGAIDTVGFIGTSLIPGTIALKGLKALQRGEAMGAFGNALRYASNNQIKFLQAANADLISQSGSLYSSVNANLLKAFAWGAVDQGAQALVAEAAIAATMKASPLTDKTSWGDMLTNSLESGIVFGAGLGGIVNAVAIKGVYKGAASAIDKSVNKYATMALDEKLALSAGDASLKAFQELADLPKEVWENDKILNYSFKLGGESFQQTLDITNKLETTLVKSADKAANSMRAALTAGLSPQDSTVGGALADLMARQVKVARNAPEHDLANTAYMAVGNKFTGMLEAEGLHSGEFTLTNYKELADKGLLPAGRNPQLFINVRTGASSLSAMPTLADMATPSIPLKFSQHGVVAGAHEFKFTTAYTPTGFDAQASIQDSARHLWASTLDRIKGTIDSEDFSLLDRIAQNPQVAQSDLKISIKGLGEISYDDFLASNVREQITSWKINKLASVLEENPSVDLRALAVKLNVEERWITQTIDQNFAKVQDGAMRPLEDYAKRETVKVTYDGKNIPKSWDQPGEGWVLHNEKVTLAREARDRASNNVLGEFATQLPELQDAKSAVQKNASRQGAGGGLFTASDADYNNALERTMQTSGVVVEKATTAAKKRALESIQAVASQVDQSPKARAELASILELGRRTEGKDGWILHTQTGASDSGYLLVKDSLSKLKAEDPEAFAQALAQAGNDSVVKIVNKETARFLEQWHTWSQDAHGRHTTLYNAAGQVSSRNAETIYFPPIDTRKLQHFAFVIPHEGRVAGKTDIGMIVAKNAAELESLAGNINREDFKVVFKRDTEEFFKAKGSYEFDRGLNSVSINSAKAKAGQLSNYTPNMNQGEALTDWLAHMERKETSIVRDAVELKYGEEIAALRTLSDEATASQTSKFGFVDKFFRQSRVKDPYGDYIKQALNISKQGEFPLLSQLNEFVDNVGRRGYEILRSIVPQAAEGKVSWEEAEAAMKRAGIGGAINEQMFLAGQTYGDRNLIKSFVRKSNAILATTQLGMDAANALVNIISSPIRMAPEILALRKMAPELMQDLHTVVGPTGPEFSAVKLQAQAIRNYWSPGAAEKLKRFIDIGAIPEDITVHRMIVDDIAKGAQLGGGKLKELEKLGEKVATVGSKLTGNTFAEKFTRFVAADVMDQLTSPLVAAGKISQAEANSYINIFVNRVQGNYHASQRPVAFQGTVGSAISLFQTYQFGMLQQLSRFIQAGDKRALFVGAGLQTSIFGLNGLPFFDAVNSHLLGKYSGNPEHKDLYSQIGGNPMGDWLLYGSASAFPLFGGKGPALYSRGDISPRQPTILPTSPADVPIVQAYGKLFGTLNHVGELLGAGAPGKDAVLFGIEHNSFSRPLAGLAQILSGQSTTSKNGLIATNDLLSIVSAARIAGARPLDEALGIQQKYRQEQYQAYDNQKLEMLGEAVKTAVRGGKVPSDEDYHKFMEEYAARGGRIENFTKALNRWTKDADVSVVNQLMQKHNNPRAQRMIEIMGGTPLQDYTNTPPETSGTTEPATGQ